MQKHTCLPHFPRPREVWPHLAPAVLPSCSSHLCLTPGQEIPSGSPCFQSYSPLSPTQKPKRPSPPSGPLHLPFSAWTAISLDVFMGHSLTQISDANFSGWPSLTFLSRIPSHLTAPCTDYPLPLFYFSFDMILCVCLFGYHQSFFIPKKV